jgi:G3E family GTPase
MKTKLILIGGFLGAGKTTMLWESARRLIAQNHSVGLKSLLKPAILG